MSQQLANSCDQAFVAGQRPDFPNCSGQFRLHAPQFLCAVELTKLENRLGSDALGFGDGGLRHISAPL
ncbi:hypothetical protein D3C85_1637650 [compost metagenome]